MVASCNVSSALSLKSSCLRWQRRRRRTVNVYPEVHSLSSRAMSCGTAFVVAVANRVSLIQSSWPRVGSWRCRCFGKYDMVLNVHEKPEGLLGTGGGGGLRLHTYRATLSPPEWVIPASRYMGNDESYFNVLLMVTNKAHHKTVSTHHNFWRERRAAEANSNQGPSVHWPA